MLRTHTYTISTRMKMCRADIVAIGGGCRMRNTLRARHDTSALALSKVSSYIYKYASCISMSIVNVKAFDNDCTYKNVQQITQFYNEHGFVLIKLLTDRECRENILEQWEKIILKQPWKDGIRLEKKNYDTYLNENFQGEYFPDNDNDDAFFTYVTKKNLSKGQLAAYKMGWPMHRNFGACCDPVVFNLPGVWKIREKQILYEVAVQVLRETKLWVSIDRSIQKLPTEGSDEFLHLDLNLEKALEEDLPNMMQGKVCYTNSTFVLVPGSHKKLKEISEKYKKEKKNQTKYSFEGQEDHLDLNTRKITIAVPAGHAIFWDSRLVHGTRKLGSNACIQYGAYIGFRPAGNRPDYFKKTKKHELEDRLSSYRKGKMPKLFPSLDKIHFYPNKWNNFTANLKTFVNKLDTGKELMIQEHKLQKKDETILLLIPERQEDYEAPPLNELGQMLLGLLKWPRLHFTALNDEELVWPQIQDTSWMQSDRADKYQRTMEHGIGTQSNQNSCYSINREITDTLQTNLYVLRL